MTDSRAAADKILDDYVSEPIHDLETLHAYLRMYPDLADALQDLHFAIQGHDLCVNDADAVDDETWLDASVARMRERLNVKPVDPFQVLSSDQLISVRQRLGIRAATLNGFRDRFVDAATIPRHVLQDFAEAVGQTLAEFLAYLAQPAQLANQSYRADGRPSAPNNKISFAQLLEQANESQDVRSRLLEDRD